jgi:hypothetical protein
VIERRAWISDPVGQASDQLSCCVRRKATEPSRSHVLPTAADTTREPKW